MRIAVCDDTIADLQHVKSHLDQYQIQHYDCPFDIAYFNHPDDFLRAFELDPAYDAVLLDMVMPFVNGIEVGRTIRNINRDLKIVYITISPEYAVESYTVKATQYLMKPVSGMALFEVLDEIRESLDTLDQPLILKDRESVMSLNIRSIEYVEVMRHHIMIHLTDGRILTSYRSLTEISEPLKQVEFFMRVHKSYIVNLRAVRNLRNQDFIMANEVNVPIARSVYKQARDAYLGIVMERGRLP